ncbi:TPR-like protein, partial [Glonium stellatum]
NIHWLVPRSVNSFFTGRTETLNRLQQELCPAGKCREVKQRRFVIVGMGGSGKSEVCLKFAEENRQRFWGVFWIDVSSKENALSSFVEVTKLCNIPDQSLNGAKQWLANTQHNWLLILDNGDRPELDYSNYFPSGNRGAILITTRLRECLTHQTVGYAEFEKLDFDDAVELLLKASGIGHDVWNVHKDSARRVVTILGQHALAITQAGAYIRNKYCTLGDYLEMFHGQRQRLLEYRPIQAKSTYGDVYATFEVSATTLGSSPLLEATHALNLLRVLAFFHFEGIPESAFTRAWKYAISIQESSSTNRAIPNEIALPERLVDQDIISLRQGCNLLASLSIITINQTNRTISMHPLAHAWAKDRMDQRTKDGAWASAAAILSLATEESTEFQNFFQSLQSHVEVCLDLCPDSCFEVYPIIQVCQMLYCMSWVVYGMHNDRKVEQITRAVIAKTRDILAPNSESMVQLRRVLGMCLVDIGNTDEAIRILEEIVEICQATSSPEHPNRLSSQSELARAYAGIGQHKKAVEILEEVVRIRRTVLSLEHPDCLDSQHALACAYIGIGQHEKAVEILEEVVRIRQTVLSPEHPGRLSSQHALACAYIGIGQHEKAVEILEEVVRIRQTVLSPKHPNCLGSQHELACAYAGLGQHKNAVEILEEVVRIEQTVLSPEHPNRLSSQCTLACAYTGIGQHKKAVGILEEVVRIRQTVLSPKHPKCLGSQHELACAYIGIGQHEKAVEILEEVVRIGRTVLSPEHPDRLASESWLEYCLTALRDDDCGISEE